MADSLSRIEPLTVEEMLDIEEKKAAFAVVTRGQKIKATKEFDIEEKYGTLLRKSDYDLVFHLIPFESDTLKNKISNKFGIVAKNVTFYKVSNVHYYRMISNQFASQLAVNETKYCINDIFKIVTEEHATSIAVNVDYDSIRHYLFFKDTFKEVFKPYNVEVTFYLNKITELKERDDIIKILELYHESVLGGHLGADRMLKTISRFYKWDGMTVDIKNFVKNCAICERTKVIVNTKVPMGISSLGDMAFDYTFVDFVGPINPPGGTTGNKYIFTATCDLTKYVVLVGTKDCTALTAAKCLLEHVLCVYNIPSRLISDNGPAFISQVMKDLTKLFAIKKILTTPYHAQSNVVERQHKTLNAYLRAFTAENRGAWDELLPFAAFSMNYYCTNYYWVFST